METRTPHAKVMDIRESTVARGTRNPNPTNTISAHRAASYFDTTRATPSISAAAIRLRPSRPVAARHTTRGCIDVRRRVRVPAGMERRRSSSRKEVELHAWPGATGSNAALADFTEASPRVHHAATLGRKGLSVMKENTEDNRVIPINIERLRRWTRWTLEATSSLVCLGLLAFSGVVAGLTGLVWLLSGSEVILTLGMGSGLLLGLAGVWHLLRQLERAANRLRHETPLV